MSCLNIQDKILLMIDSMQIAKRMLSDDSIRPEVKYNVEEELSILRQNIRELYIDLFKIINN